MKLEELARLGGNVQIVISASELKEAFRQWAAEERASIALSLRETRTESKKDRFPKMLTRKETTEILRVSEKTLWTYEKQGLLKPVKVAGRVLYHPDDVAELARIDGHKAV